MSRVKDFNDAIQIVTKPPGWIRKSKNFSQFDRDLPPMRGYARQLQNWSMIEKEVRLIKDLYKNWLDSNRRKLTIPIFNSINTWETFQEVQKGPTAPLVGREAFRKLIEDLIKYNQPFSIEADYLKLFEESKALLENHFFPTKFKQESLVNIDYRDYLLSLPRGTVRGGPFWGKGGTMDEEIIRVFGTDPKEVIKVFNSTHFILCTPGYRISGSPYKNEAKFRLVFIPDMFYQYFVNGITHRVMNYLKKYPAFCGWLDPLARKKILSDKYLEVKKKGYELIQLDYSAYDKHIHSDLQISVLTIYDKFFSDWELVSDSFSKKLMNQSLLFFNNNGKDHTYLINNQLISGKSDTQLMGSFIGLCLTTAFLISKYGVSETKNLVEYLFQLGDDTLFPVKLDSDYTYEDALEEYSDFCGKFGFTLNPKKAYPTQEPAFLQKLIRPDFGLDSVGTWQRSLMSFLFSEKFKHNELGSTRALDIISQISILENAYVFSNDILNSFYDVFAEFWLRRDKSLKELGFYLKSKSKDNRLTSNALFFALVNLAGVKNITQMLEALDSLSYDHSGLKLKLEEKDYGVVFHILPSIVKILNKENYQGTLNLEKIVNEFSADHILNDEDLSKELVDF